MVKESRRWRLGKDGKCKALIRSGAMALSG